MEVIDSVRNRKNKRHKLGPFIGHLFGIPLTVSFSLRPPSSFTTVSGLDITSYSFLPPNTVLRASDVTTFSSSLNVYMLTQLYLYAQSFALSTAHVYLSVFQIMASHW